MKHKYQNSKFIRNSFFKAFVTFFFFLFKKLLEKVGFVDVKAVDNTKRFIEVLKSERKRFETDRDIFLKVKIFKATLVLWIICIINSYKKHFKGQNLWLGTLDEKTDLIAEFLTP